MSNYKTAYYINVHFLHVYGHNNTVYNTSFAFRARSVVSSCATHVTVGTRDHRPYALCCRILIVSYKLPIKQDYKQRKGTEIFIIVPYVIIVSFFQLHAVSRTYKGGQREPSVKTLCSPLSAEFRRLLAQVRCLIFSFLNYVKSK